MTSFKLAFHGITGRRIVEVFEGDEFIAAIYPDSGERSVKIVSKHPMHAVPDNEGKPGALQVRFGREAEQRADTVHTVEPHDFVPDLMAMGDCRICGHTHDSPIHDRKART